MMSSLLWHGVQPCALPICPAPRGRRLRRGVAVEVRVEVLVAVGGFAQHIGVCVGRRRGEQAERRAHRLIAGDGEREIVAEQAKLVDRFEAGEAAAQRAQRLGRIEGAEIAELAAVEDRRAAVIRMNPGLRSDARRVGKECVSTCRSRWSPYTSNKK